MKAVIELTNVVTQVKVPLPFPLRWVNGYLLRGRQGYTLIDPGLHTVESETLWQETFKELGISFADIERIVLTHHHPDHYGLAGWMRKMTGAPVWMSRKGHTQALRLWGEGQPLTEAILAQFQRGGLPKEQLALMKPHLDSFVPLVSPQPEVRFIEPGESFQLGDESYAVIEAPGHAEGQLIFYNERKRVIFCGDQVLPQISPNISLIPGVDANPLASFLRSLGELSLLPVEQAYPGHREPFTAFAERAKELVAHHEARLALMRGHLREPMTAYELCRRVFGDRLTVHQLRFAMAETLAHTENMRLQGAVAAEEREGEDVYSAIGG